MEEILNTRIWRRDIVCDGESRENWTKNVRNLGGNTVKKKGKTKCDKK